MTFSLIDSADASIVGRGTVSGTESELVAQLPFALDSAIASLRRRDDPPIGAMLMEHVQLAVLPVRLVGVPAAVARPARATVAGAAAELASRMKLSLLDEGATTAITTAAGCAAADLRCALPAAASRGAKLGLAVSVVGGARVVVRATLLRPDSSVAGEAERTASANTEDAIVASIADAVMSAGGVSGGSKGKGPPAAPRPAPVLTALPKESKPAGSNQVRDIVDDDEIDEDAVDAPEGSAARPATFACLLTADGVTLGGRCGVAGGRFRFTALSSSARGGVVDIALTDVKEARARRSSVVDNGIELVLSDGAQVSFQVEVKVRDRLLRAIKRGSKR